MRNKSPWMVSEDGLKIGMFRIFESAPYQSPINQEHYQTTTMDSGVLETLYEGASLECASNAALEHEGKSSVVHFRYDGTCRNVADYKGGRMLTGYMYE